MWTPEVVQLKSGITIVVELKFELPKSRFIFYVTVGDIYNFDSWKTDTKNLVFIGNIIKWDNAKDFLLLTRKTPFLCFSFSDYTYMFTYICLSLFMHTIQNKDNFSSSNITYWKSDMLLVKVQSALYWLSTRPLSLNEF